MWIEVGITGGGERHEEGSRGGTGVGIEMRRGLNGRMDLGLGMGFRLGLGLGLRKQLGGRRGLGLNSGV